MQKFTANGIIDNVDMFLWMSFDLFFRRLMFPFTCPNNGSRNDSCYCTDKGNTNPGLTRFTQIRIDLYHMKINCKFFSFKYNVIFFMKFRVSKN